MILGNVLSSCALLEDVELLMLEVLLKMEG